MGDIALQYSIFLPHAFVHVSEWVVILYDTIKGVCLNIIQEGGGNYQLIVQS